MTSDQPTRRRKAGDVVLFALAPIVVPAVVYAILWAYERFWDWVF